MKLFKLLIVIISITPFQNLICQSNLSKENQSIADSFIKEELAIIVDQQFVADKERLVFKEYTKIENSEIEKLKVTFPTYLLIDKKAKPGKKINQEISNETIYTDLQFDFTDASFVVFLNSKESINNKFITNYYEFRDLIVSKYISENSNEIYYICKLNYGNTISYGIFKDSDLVSSNKQKNYEFVVNGKEQLDLIKIKSEAKKYLGGNMDKIFPDNEIYLYDVLYDISIPNSDKKLKFTTIAISNTKEKKINLDDFYSNKNHKPIEFKFKSSINIYKLLLNPILIDSVNTTKGLETSAYRYWEGDDQDKRINNEAKLMRQDLKNFSKFNSLYFNTKLKELGYLNSSKKAPYLIRAKAGNGIQFDFLTDDFDRRYEMNGSSINLNIKDTEIIFSFEAKNTEKYGYQYSEFNYNPKTISRVFDSRVDSLNLKFVYVDPKLLLGYKDVYFQKDLENLLNFNVEECLVKLNGYNEYLQQTTSQNKTDSKNKEVLYSKYGKKYVDSALAGNIIVGMPEDLLIIPMNLWQITRRTNFKNGFEWFCYSKINSSKKLLLTVTNKKVSYVNSY